MNDGVADRPQQQAAQAASAMAAHDDELGGFRLLDQLPGRLVADDEPVDGYVGVALLPAGQAFGKTPLRFRLHLLPVESREFENLNVTPRVQRRQLDTATRRLVERYGGRQLRGGRAIDAEQHRGLQGVR